jgi:hypothetical protein
MQQEYQETRVAEPWVMISTETSLDMLETVPDSA